VEGTFLRPPVSTCTVFASSTGFVGFLTVEALEAVRKLNPTLTQAWRDTYLWQTLESLRGEVPLMTSLSDAGMKEMAQACELTVVPPSTSLTRLGGEAEAFYVLLDGEVEEESAKGVRYLHGGQSFGENALVNNTTNQATRRTTVSCVVLSLRAADFFRILGSNQKALINIKLRAQGGETELINVLRHSVGYQLLLGFLNKEFASENLLFWQVTDRFERKARQLQKHVIMHNLVATRGAGAGAGAGGVTTGGTAVPENSEVDRAIVAWSSGLDDEEKSSSRIIDASARSLGGDSKSSDRNRRRGHKSMNDVLEEQAKGLTKTGEEATRNNSSLVLSQRGSSNLAREALWEAAESIVTEFVKADAP